MLSSGSLEERLNENFAIHLVEKYKNIQEKKVLAILQQTTKIHCRNVVGILQKSLQMFPILTLSRTQHPQSAAAVVATGSGLVLHFAGLGKNTSGCGRVDVTAGNKQRYRVFHFY